jgi:hypothetical protein
VRPQLNLGFLTVKANDSTTLHTLAFDLSTGEIKWRRQLGAVPVVPPIPQPGGGHLVVDESGGVYRLSNQMGSDAVTVEPVSAPLAVATFPAKVAHTADGKTVWVVVGESDREGQKLLVRKLDGGKPAGEFKASIPASLAGVPAVLGDFLLLPLNNGYVYRLNVDKPQPAQGPVWRGADAIPDSVCHLTAAGPIEFLATDGGKSVFRWKWADDQMTAEKAGGPWQSNETITAVAQLMPVGGVTYLMVPDQSGVSAFEIGKPTEEPVRRWRGDKDLGIAGGRVTHLSVVGQRVVVSIEGKALMGLDPTKDAAVWGVADWPSPEAGEVMGMIDTGDSVLVTYQAGPVRQYRVADGGMIGEAERAVGSPIIPVAACPAGIPNRILVSNTDGTLAVVTLIPRR